MFNLLCNFNLFTCNILIEGEIQHAFWISMYRPFSHSYNAARNRGLNLR